MKRSWFVLAALCSLVFAGCSSSAVDAQSGTSSGTSQSQTSDLVAQPTKTAQAVASCQTAKVDVVTDVASGLKKPATGLSNPKTVATTRAEQKSGEEAQVMLAARVDGVTGRPVGVWAYGDGTIDAVNAVAEEYSEWGAAAEPGSPAIHDRELALKYPETKRVLACVKSSTTTSGPSASRGANPCGFPQAPDVIYWVKTPGQAAMAERLGAYNLGNCTRTADQTQLDKSSPQGSGYCTIVASIAANPGYNFDAEPSVRPKGVEAQSGAGC